MGGVAWATWVLIAATLRVDGDAKACPGDGSEGAPFCTLQDAFDSALAPGDEIVVRDAATAYAGGNVANVDGGEGDPIVLRPDDGHVPIVGGRIELDGSSYWVIRGLTFDGQGAEPGHSAIVTSTGSEIVNGIVIEDNTIVDWGGALIELLEDGVGSGIIHVSSYGGMGELAMVDPIVRNNRILASRGKGILLVNTMGGRIEGNEIAESTCQMEPNGPGMSAIHVSSAPGTIIARNRIRDSDVSECSLAGDMRVTGVWVQGSSEVEVHHNLVERMGNADAAGEGINLIHGADDCVIHHNIIVDADQCGLCNGVLGSDGGNRARFVANTVIGGRGTGITLLSGEDSEFIGNVVIGAGGAQVRILRTAEISFEGGVTTWFFHDNLYFPAAGEDNIARFEYSSPVDFATWSSECACDADTIVADPMLPPGGSENFTAAAESPIVDGSVDLPEATAFNGAAVDLGAVEAPIAGAASIAAAEPDRIRLELQSETSALRHDPGCAGFLVTIDGTPVAATACELDGDRILVRLAESAHAGDTVVLAYAGAAIGNSDAIGGVVDGLLQPFEIEVANGSEEPQPAESGSDDASNTSDATNGGDSEAGPSTVSASGSAGPTEADTDPGSGADYPAVDGCSCNHRESASPMWALLLLLALRRRTIATTFAVLVACQSSNSGSPPVLQPDVPAKTSERRHGLRTQPHPAWVEVKASRIPGAGEGAFAIVDIPKEAYIGYYRGRYIAPGKTNPLAGTRESLYLFTLPECAQDDTRDTIVGDVNDYVSKVNYAPRTINGKPTNLQNSSFRTACEEPFVRLYAKRDIAAGEELYVDYGPRYDYHFMALPEVQDYFLQATGIEKAASFDWQYAEQQKANDRE